MSAGPLKVQFFLTWVHNFNISIFYSFRGFCCFVSFTPFFQLLVAHKKSAIRILSFLCPWLVGGKKVLPLDTSAVMINDDELADRWRKSHWRKIHHREKNITINLKVFTLVVFSLTRLRSVFELWMKRKRLPSVGKMSTGPKQWGFPMKVSEQQMDIQTIAPSRGYI